jgi:flagellar basal-body rod protein FlgC
MFAAYNIAETGLQVNQEWINAVSDNIANLNTDVPTSQAAFQARFIEAQAVGGQSGPGATPNSSTAATNNAIGSGVEVTGVALGSAAGTLVSDPGNPMADAQGMIRAPDIDLGQQMTQLIMAQNGYEANLAVVSRATQAYQSALGLSV